MKQTLYSLLIFFTFFTGIAFSEVIDPGDLLDNNQIVIIGEKEGNVETAKFFTSFVDEYAKGGKCLKVGIEVGSDQQDKITKSVEDKKALEGLVINGVYEAVGILGIITNINNLIREGRCIKIYALGPPSTVPVESAAWMEKELPKLVKQDSVPLLLVVKLKDSLKYFDWNNSGQGKPFLAERLSQKGIKVASVLNYWQQNFCDDVETVATLSSDNPLAVTYVNKLIYSEVQFLPKKASTVTDAVNVWKCDIDPVEEAKKLVDEDEIKDGLRQGRPIVGMNREQVVEAIGSEPVKKDFVDDTTEIWKFSCPHEDGYYFNCYNVTFTGDVATGVRGY